MMLGSKGLLPPLIPDCSALCAPAILKNIQNPPESGYFFMFLAGPKFKNPLASKLASDFRPFDPGIIVLKENDKGAGG